jgi:hypothetical protein
VNRSVVLPLLRRLAVAASGLVAALGVAPSTVAAGDLPDPVPVPVLPAIDAASGGASGGTPTRIIPLPAGCAAPPIEQAVFVGTLALRDATTARFTVDRLRSGSLEGFALGGQVDVVFGDEVRFLVDGAQYIVGAGIDVDRRALVSTVREPTPIFGGSEVAGVNSSEVACPTIDDPVRTLNIDGSDVESGVLAPLDGKSWMLLRAVLQPLGAALLVVLGLVVMKHLVFALGRTLRDLR